MKNLIILLYINYNKNIKFHNYLDPEIFCPHLQFLHFQDLPKHYQCYQVKDKSTSNAVIKLR